MPEHPPPREAVEAAVRFRYPGAKPKRVAAQARDDMQYPLESGRNTITLARAFARYHAERLREMADAEQDKDRALATWLARVQRYEVWSTSGNEDWRLTPVKPGGNLSCATWIKYADALAALEARSAAVAALVEAAREVNAAQDGVGVVMPIRLVEALATLSARLAALEDGA